MNFISPHVFKRAFAYLLLSLLGFRVGPSLFETPFVKPFSLWTFLFFYDYVRCGLWASSGPFPLSAHYGLYKRGRDLVAYDPRRHQDMTLRRRWSRHLRASSHLDRRRRRIPSFTTPSETLFSPRARARRAIFPFSLLL